MKFVLPLTADYVKDWTTWDAVRELLQNAMDAHTKGGVKPIIEWTAGNLIISSPGERLARRSLLFGGTDKVEGDRGRFGEGYKLALLVFARNDQAVIVRNGVEVWSASFEDSPDFDGEEVLQIDIVEHTESYDGVQFLIGGVTKKDYDDFMTKCIPNEPYGILPKTYNGGQVFVGGLFVTKLENLVRSYNFHPRHIQLGRDRNIVISFDLQWQTSELWRQSKNHSELVELLEVEAIDVEYLQPQVSKDAANAVYMSFISRYGSDTIPVENQIQLDEVRAAGGKAQIVSSKIVQIIRTIKEFVLQQFHGPSYKLKKFLEKHKSSLPDAAKVDLEALIEEAKSWR